jgi:hypothetical protein
MTVNQMEVRLEEVTRLHARNCDPHCFTTSEQYEAHMEERLRLSREMCDLNSAIKAERHREWYYTGETKGGMV